MLNILFSVHGSMNTENTRSEVQDGFIETVEVSKKPPEFPSTTEVCIVAPTVCWYFEHKTPDVKGPRTLWKKWEHYRRSCNLQSLGCREALFTVDLVDNISLHAGRSKVPYFTYGSQFGGPGETNVGLPVFYQLREDGGFVPPPSGLGDLKQQSLNAMLPRIKSELSIINSILELRDFRSLPRSISNVLRLARTIIRSGQPLRSILRASADAYLQTRFNIMPLLSDISGIYRAIKRTERRINDFIAREGRVRTSHFTRSLTESDLSYTDSASNGLGLITRPSGGVYPTATTAVHTRTVYTDPAIFHAELKYNYNYTAYQREHARILSLLDSIGVNLNPAIIWNAIPWSFVVDWVLGVSRYLDQQRLGNMDPKINILQYLWSVKRYRRIYLTSRVTSNIYYAGYDGGNAKYPTEGITHPVVEESAYRRDVGVPDESSLIASGLSLDEFSLGAALVFSRGHRHRRRR